MPSRSTSKPKSKGRSKSASKARKTSKSRSPAKKTPVSTPDKKTANKISVKSPSVKAAAKAAPKPVQSPPETPKANKTRTTAGSRPSTLVPSARASTALPPRRSSLASLSQVKAQKKYPFVVRLLFWFFVLALLTYVGVGIYVQYKGDALLPPWAKPYYKMWPWVAKAVRTKEPRNPPFKRNENR